MQKLLDACGNVLVYVCLKSEDVMFENDPIVKQLISTKHFESPYDVCFLEKTMPIQELETVLPQRLLEVLKKRREIIVVDRRLAGKITRFERADSYLVLRLKREKDL